MIEEKQVDLNVDEIKLELSDDAEDENNNVVYACQKCPATYESRKKLKEHSKRIHSEKKFICPTCGFEVFGSNNFYNHKRKHKEKAKCPICEKEFRGLAKHMEKCVGPRTKKKQQKKYFFDRCEKSFLTQK